MSWLAAAYNVSGALPVVAVVAATGIIALCVAGWVIRDVARAALQKSSEENIPYVLAALGGLLEQLRMFLPWQSAGHKSVAPEPPSEQSASHTKSSSKNLSRGGSQ
jgi:hypothetical protein